MYWWKLCASTVVCGEYYQHGIGEGELTGQFSYIIEGSDITTVVCGENGPNNCHVLVKVMCLP